MHIELKLNRQGGLQIVVFVLNFKGIKDQYLEEWLKYLFSSFMHCPRTTCYHWFYIFVLNVRYLEMYAKLCIAKMFISLICYRNISMYTGWVPFVLSLQRQRFLFTDAWWKYNHMNVGLDFLMGRGGGHKIIYIDLI